MALNSKIIFAGYEGSGKSLKMSAYVIRALEDNARYFKKTGIARPIYSNMQFSQKFHARADKKKIPIVYWRNLDDIVGLSGCDIFIDEIGAYFDSRLWSELSLDIRRWIAQCDKNGVNIYGTAQDFAQVDKSFRRLVRRLISVRKILGSPRPHPSYPKVKHPWGLFMVRDLDPAGYKEDEPKLAGMGIPGFFRLKSKYYSIFDTNAGVELSKPLPLKHVARKCPDCGVVVVKHL